MDFRNIVELATLRGAGARTITIEYSGGSDSGQTDAIHTDRDDVPVSPELQEVLEDWAWDDHTGVIPNTGWWNNAGGYGRVEIDLETYTATIHHTDRSDFDYTTQPGDTVSADPSLTPILDRLRALGATEVRVRVGDDEDHDSYEEVEHPMFTVGYDSALHDRLQGVADRLRDAMEEANQMPPSDFERGFAVATIRLEPPYTIAYSTEVATQQEDTTEHSVAIA